MPGLSQPVDRAVGPYHSHLEISRRGVLAGSAEHLLLCVARVLAGRGCKERVEQKLLLDSRGGWEG
jgi:hypothetical protein